MSRGFANPLTELAEFEELQQSLKKKQGPVQVSGCLDSQKVHLMQETMADRPWKLVVTYDDARAKEIYDDFGCFRDNVWLYPAKDLLFYSADIHGNLITRERLQVLRHLMEDESGVVVTTMDGLMDHLLPLSCMREQVLHLETGQEHASGGRHGPVFRAGRYSGHLPADGGASGAYRAVGYRGGFHPHL